MVEVFPELKATVIESLMVLRKSLEKLATSELQHRP